MVEWEMFWKHVYLILIYPHLCIMPYAQFLTFFCCCFLCKLNLDLQFVKLTSRTFFAWKEFCLYSPYINVIAQWTRAFFPQPAACFFTWTIPSKTQENAFLFLFPIFFSIYKTKYLGQIFRKHFRKNSSRVVNHSSRFFWKAKVSTQ